MGQLNIDNACSNSVNEEIGTTSLEALSCNLQFLDRFTNSQNENEIDRTGTIRQTVQGRINSIGGFITEAPLTGGPYVRVNGSWVEFTAP